MEVTQALAIIRSPPLFQTWWIKLFLLPRGFPWGSKSIEQPKRLFMDALVTNDAGIIRPPSKLCGRLTKSVMLMLRWCLDRRLPLWYSLSPPKSFRLSLGLWCDEVRTNLGWWEGWVWLKGGSRSTTSRDCVEDSSIDGMPIVENVDVLPMMESFRLVSCVGVIGWGDPGASRLYDPTLKLVTSFPWGEMRAGSMEEVFGTRSSPAFLNSMLNWSNSVKLFG